MTSRSSLLVGGLVGLALLVAAQGLRAGVVRPQRDAWPKVVDEPFAPSPSAAPYVTLGYREAAADLFYTRAKVYFGGEGDTASGFRGLIDAVVTLDPSYLKAYELGARGVQYVDGGHDQADIEWSTRLLERGLREFPDRWQLALLLGQIYVLDLVEQPEMKIDAPPELIAQWRNRGLELLDRAIRSPGAPTNLATLIASVRTKAGQLDRVARDLAELIQTTNDPDTRARLIARLAELQNESAEQLEYESEIQARRLDLAWKRALPEAPLEMYLRVGDPPKPYIDLRDLAAEPLVGAEEVEVYEPIPE